MLIRENALKESYVRYQSNQIKGLCNQIPETKKEELLEEIKARALFFGCSNQSALKSAQKHLKPKEEKNAKVPKMQ